MIVFTSSLRHARRPRRIPTVAAVVRALGTVRVSDQPDAWSPCPAQAAPRPPHSTITRRRGPAGSAHPTS